MDTYFTIVNKEKLYSLVKDELLKVLPIEQVEILMIELGYNNDKYVYNLGNCAQVCRELLDGNYVVSVQLCPNKPPYKDFFKNKGVQDFIKNQELQIAYLMYGKENIFNQDVYFTLEFKEIEY